VDTPDVLDAAALLTVARDEPGAAEVVDLLRQGRCLVAAVNYAEVLDVLLRREAAPDRPVAALLSLVGHGLEVADVDRWTAEAAAELCQDHYHRARRPVSLADCTCAAVAALRQGRVVTSDRALLELCADEDLPTVALPR
jgi:PIN domain nuclease of toxin-antitoxin system